MKQSPTLQQYYIWIAGEESGPHDESEMRAALSDGTLDSATLVRTEGGAEWKPAALVFAPPAQVPSKNNRSDAPAMNTEAKAQVASPGMTRLQGNLILILLCIGLGMPFFAGLKPTPRWEYRKVMFFTEGFRSRTGASAMNYNSIALEDPQLQALGNEGWELAGSYLEMETAFPNFGREDLVTGLQPNIRPQCLVLLFKRPK